MWPMRMRLGVVIMVVLTDNDDSDEWNDDGGLPGGSCAVHSAVKKHVIPLGLW